MPRGRRPQDPASAADLSAIVRRAIEQKADDPVRISRPHLQQPHNGEPARQSAETVRHEDHVTCLNIVVEEGDNQPRDRLHFDYGDRTGTVRD